MNDDYFWKVQYADEIGSPVALFITKTDATLFAHVLSKQEGIEFEVVEK